MIVDVPLANMSDAPVSDCEVNVANANDLLPLIFFPLSKAPFISDMFKEMHGIRPRHYKFSEMSDF